MSNLNRVFSKVDREVVAEVEKLHIGAQVYRFLRIALFAFVTSLPLDGGHVGWSALASLGAGALETAFRQAYPSFPLDKTTSVVTRAVKDQATAIATEAVNAQILAVEDRHRQAIALLESLGQKAKAMGVTVAAPAAATPPEPPAAAAVASPVATAPPAAS